MPKSKFKAIYKELKADIESERLPYQSLMPSENQLIVRFDCSRNTVRRAIAMLAEEGYVQPMHGRGVRVIYTKTQTPPFLIAGIESFGESARRNNLKTTTKLIRFTELTADDHISHRTGFAVGTDDLLARRVGRRSAEKRSIAQKAVELMMLEGSWSMDLSSASRRSMRTAST